MGASRQRLVRLGERVERSSGAAPPLQPGASNPLSVEVEPGQDGVRIVSLAGELDLATTPIAEGPLFGELAAGRDVLVDLTGLSFIDSSGIGLLIRAFRADGGSRMHTVIVRDSQVDRVFRLVGLDRAMPLHFGREEALAALEGGG
jgi:anti-anti-sigma factor